MKMITLSRLTISFAAAAVLMATATGTANATVDSYCMNTSNGYGGSDNYYPYMMNNNTFNWSIDSGGSYECFSLNYVNSENGGSYYYGFGSSWNWDYNSSTQYDVKAYPSMVYGWQYGYAYSGLGLPTRIWNNTSVPVYMSFSLSGSQNEDVLIDNWILDNPNATSGQSDELEVFVQNDDGSYSSGNDNLGGITVNGVYYYLSNRYISSGGSGWENYTFIPNITSESYSQGTNMEQFVNDITYDYGGLSNSQYLAGTQVGVEIYHGSGSVTFNPSAISAN